jgi:hypothetical protein
MTVQFGNPEKGAAERLVRDAHGKDEPRETPVTRKRIRLSSGGLQAEPSLDPDGSVRSEASNR